jgi:archaellum biogenesis protein FlaJ (TadC family)
VPIATTAGHSVPLKIFFGFVFVALLTVTLYVIRNRKGLFSHKGADDTYASANLRMWMVILVLIHAIILSLLMIYEV